MGALLVLTKFSLLVVSSLASQAPSQAQQLRADMPVVALLTNDDFVLRYAEKNPLDRCVMAEDLGRVFAKQPQRVAIDFDLSPLLKPSASERECQDQLNQLLQQHAGTVVLLAPFPTSAEPLLQVKHDWMQAQCQHGLHFATGEIEQSLGVVTELNLGDDATAHARLADQLHHGLSSYLCDQVTPLRNARDNRWLNERWQEQDKMAGHELGHDAAQHEPESAPINFPALTRRVAVMALNSPTFAQLPDLKENVVLVGGDWGRDDNFLTAIGNQPGVVVHAARLVSLANPIKSLPPFLGLWGDIVIALSFAWVIARFWKGYVAARRVDLSLAHRARRTSLSTLLMFTFVMVYLGLVLFFFMAAEHLFSNWGVVIAPLLIALSILVDGFVSGPVEQISDLLAEESERTFKRPGETSAQPHHHHLELAAALRQSGIAILMLMAFGAAVVLAPGATRQAAAALFAGAQIGLLGLLLLHLGRQLKTFKLGATLQALQGAARAALDQWQPGGASYPSTGLPRLEQLGLLLWWLRNLVFWGVMGWGAALLLSHSAA
nr:CHASE2 domain-containing protein [Roseateles koreensis]